MMMTFVNMDASRHHHPAHAPRRLRPAELSRPRPSSPQPKPFFDILPLAEPEPSKILTRSQGQ